MIIKYIPKAMIRLFVIALGVPIIILLMFLLELLILYLVLAFWILFMGFYALFIIKEEVDPLSDNEYKELLDILETEEIIEYIKYLVYNKKIKKTFFIGIEIDEKFKTNLTQKKGWNAGKIRDEKLFNKLDSLCFKIIKSRENV
ncbi:MAG: hypothetical protein ACFFEN_08430 [Candidatus Thorarchaeota archaeon]